MTPCKKLMLINKVSLIFQKYKFKIIFTKVDKFFNSEVNRQLTSNCNGICPLNNVTITRIKLTNR